MRTIKGVGRRAAALDERIPGDPPKDGARAAAGWSALPGLIGRLAGLAAPRRAGVTVAPGRAGHRDLLPVGLTPADGEGLLGRAAAARDLHGLDAGEALGAPEPSLVDGFRAAALA